ncbi:MAG: HEPN domain-containing protein [Actinomycetota bacterium]|nr:HEPN domain-containing protein [Actinomycetota bacterium]
MKGNPEDEAGRWLLQATDEFTDACDLNKRERYYLALFHFQQAAEKALKAFLYLKLEEPDVFRTHSVAELVEATEKINPGFSRVKRSKSLDAYYIPTRYPNGLPGGVPSRFYDDPTEAEEAERLAGQVIQMVKEEFSVSE